MRMWFEVIYNYMMPVFWIVAASFLIYSGKVCYGHWRVLKYVNKFEKPTTDYHSILGHWKLLSQSSDNLFKTVRALGKEFYPHYALRVFHRAAVNIISPEDCEILMSSKKHNSKSEIYLLLHDWMRGGLLLSTDDKWTQRRKILTPAFHFEILRDFIVVFNEGTERLLNIISTKCSEEVDVIPLFSEFALCNITETAMGVKLDLINQNQKRYRAAVYDIEELILYRLLRPWLHYLLIYNFTPTFRREWRLLKTLHGFTKNVIGEKQRNFNGKSEISGPKKEVDDEKVYDEKKKRLALLDILLRTKDHGNQIDYEGICEEVDTFMFEGHHTIAAALSFCLMLIATHCEIQEKLYEEIKFVLGEENTKPEYHHLQKMELLDRCIKESLRLYPSVHLISRCVSQDTVLHSGLTVPKGGIIIIHIYDVHRNPVIYPDPERFDPDRFLPDACQHRHPFAYIPFSAGPRNCIGQKFAMLEMKAVLTGILQRFKVVAVDTPDTIVFKEEMILRAANGVKMIFSERN